MHDSWVKFFKDPGFARCSTCQGIVGEFLRVGPGQDLQYPMGIEAGSCASNVLGANISLPTKRYVYSRLFEFKPEIMEKHASLLTSLGLDGVPYVGVHLRRGDKASEMELMGLPQSSALDFAVEIRKQCKLINAGGESTCHVFLASDDSSSLASCRRSFLTCRLYSRTACPTTCTQ